MPKIFISYRRADSADATDSLFIQMEHHFGKGNVFQDVSNIPFGVDFRDYLRDQIAAHDVILVVIGPQWAQMMKERADQPNDFVRIEIENALNLNKLVIPVRVMNAPMPDFSDLPDSIADLQWRNGAVVRRRPDLETDCTRLADGIRAYLDSIGKPTTAVGTAFLPSAARNRLPAPFEWIEIPGKGYSIAKYPVTNAQFQAFVDAPDGYNNPAWWDFSGDAKQWREQNNIQQTSFPGDRHPRTNICWYEAVAFCRWLSVESGENIKLPSESQWKYAAQGPRNYDYPWGNGWNCQRCNNSVLPCKSSSTTPVEQYAGKNYSPFEVVDMAGNVWEWCLTTYSHSDDVTRTGERRMIYGGSWNSFNVQDFHISNRTSEEPDSRDGVKGFRIIRMG